MSVAIRTRIVRIGNSQGIRIPKLLLEQSGIQTDVEMEVQSDHLTIHRAPQLRVGWDEAFATMADHYDDVLLDGPIDGQSLTDWEQHEWEW